VKRVLVIGHPGSGKSTFALDLSKKTGLPVIHLDKEFWQSGWKPTQKDKWRQRVENMAGSEVWIMDGTYDRTLDIRLLRADTVIFLDYSRFLCLWRVIKRIITNFGRVRSNMADGCPERIDLDFLIFAWRYRRDRYPKVNEMLQNFFVGGKLIVLRGPADAARLLSQIEPK
jgi:adenylate kinase family enzyme